MGNQTRYIEYERMYRGKRRSRTFNQCAGDEKSATHDENVQFVKRYGYSKEVRSRQERNNTRILEWHLPR
jgi:hypothetical protein